jgi:universal stress protein A
MSFRRILIALDDSAIAAHAVPASTAWQFLREGKPADEILAAAREWEADVIVIGTHGRSGVSRLVLGSTADLVVRHAPCPVLVIKPHV